MKDRLWLTLTIGIIPVRVYLCEMNDDEDGWYKNDVIRINKNLSKEERFSTLVHECIHCILNQYGWQEIIEKTDIPEEPLVMALEHGIIQMLGPFLRRPK